MFDTCLFALIELAGGDPNNGITNFIRNVSPDRGSPCLYP